MLAVPVSLPNATPNPLLAAPPEKDIGAAEPNALCVVPAVEAPKPVDCPNAGFGSDPEFCCGVDVELPVEGTGCPDELLGPTLALEFPPAEPPVTPPPNADGREGCPNELLVLGLELVDWVVELPNEPLPEYAD